MAKKKKGNRPGGHHSPADHLPKHKPKATGKKGIGPLDHDTEDTSHTASEMAAMDEPNVKEGTTAANNLSEQAPATKKEPPKQLLKISKPPTPAVQNDRMSMHFIGFRAHRMKDRTRVVTMKFSMELEDAHEGRLPEPIEKEWSHFKKAKTKLTKLGPIDTQKVDMAIASDQDGFEFTANVPFAALTRITEKGKGATRNVIRLEIHFLTTFAMDAEQFCRNTFDETVWATIDESQDSLFDEDDEE